jgi:hypothetical protein
VFYSRRHVQIPHKPSGTEIRHRLLRCAVPTRPQIHQRRGQSTGLERRYGLRASLCLDVLLVVHSGQLANQKVSRNGPPSGNRKERKHRQSGKRYRTVAVLSGRLVTALLSHCQSVAVALQPSAVTFNGNISGCSLSDHGSVRGGTGTKYSSV